MERTDNVGDREDQSSSNGNEEIQLGRTGNQLNPLYRSWTTKAKYGRDAAILQENDTHNPGSCSNAVQSSAKRTCRMGISRIQNHQSVTQNKGEVLGLKKHHHTEWISIETLDRIKERKNKKAAINNSRTRAEKVRAQSEYIEANKQVKKSIKADKQKYVEELAKTAEKVAREGNMKQLYDATKKLAGKYSKPERPVNDKEGRPITEIQQQRKRWVEYFEKRLNRPAPMIPPDIEAAHTDLPIDVNPPTKEEIRVTIRQIKSEKAAEPDNIPAEAQKSDIELINSLSPIWNTVSSNLTTTYSMEGFNKWLCTHVFKR
ncbi:unnamed protein product [Schistosoma curassoni]|uniref:Coiled-coil domain-containing protein n=1 Tax=Schistosoma curassoni TaxID=6186 RepID=A0A183KM27_9TREM|nr:unnamed protein product [Schistosoma curassoni]